MALDEPIGKEFFRHINGGLRTRLVDQFVEQVVWTCRKELVYKPLRDELQDRMTNFEDNAQGEIRWAWIGQ